MPAWVDPKSCLPFSNHRFSASNLEVHLYVGVSKNQGHLIWTPINSRILDIKAPT